MIGPSRWTVPDIKVELLTGLIVFVQTTPLVIGAGIVAFSPLGAEYTTLGTQAALYAAVFATILASLLGGSVFQWTAPRVALAAVVGTLAANLLRDPTLTQAAAGSAVRPETVVVTLMFLSVFLAGGFQVLFGVLRLGTLIRFMPYPVVAGFMNGISVLIVLDQLPHLLGLPGVGSLPGVLEGTVRLAWQPLVLALATLAATLIVVRLRPSLPTALVILFVGIGIYYTVNLATGGVFRVEMLGVVPAGLPVPSQASAFADLLRLPQGWSLAGTVVGASVSMALIGSFQSLISAAVGDSLSHTRHDSNRELLAQGIGNAVASLFGGLPSGGSPSQVPAAYHAGSRSRLSRVVTGVLFLFVAMGLGRVFAVVPVAVVSVILLKLAVDIFPAWNRQLLKRLLTGRKWTRHTSIIFNLAITLLVTVLMLTVGIVTAVAAGMGLSLLFFMQAQSQGVIRREYRGDVVHSRLRRRRESMAYLMRHGRAIQVFELQGPIFFGSSDELARRVEDQSGDARYVLLDFKRVNDVDSTGARFLDRLDKVLASRGRTMAITYLTPGQDIYGFLMDMGVLDEDLRQRVFRDTESALVWAEDQLLKRREREQEDDSGIGLHEVAVMEGLGKDDLAYLAAHLLDECEYQPGERIIAEGDHGDRMFFLVRGTVDVTKKLPDGEVRLMSLRPGFTFGSMALLTGEPRSADVGAKTRVECYALTEPALQRLCEDHPRIAIRLLLNISRELADRLAATSRVVQELEK
ncbi:MAG: SulP family inorganic anion transporter [Arenicellales bacterium]